MKHLQCLWSLNVNLGNVLVGRLRITIWGGVCTVFGRSVRPRSFPRFQPILPLIVDLYLLRMLLRLQLWIALRCRSILERRGLAYWRRILIHDRVTGTTLTYSLRKRSCRRCSTLHQHSLLNVFWVCIRGLLILRINPRNCLIVWRLICSRRSRYSLLIHGPLNLDLLSKRLTCLFFLLSAATYKLERCLCGKRLLFTTCWNTCHCLISTHDWCILVLHLNWWPILTCLRLHNCGWVWGSRIGVLSLILLHLLW